MLIKIAVVLLAILGLMVSKQTNKAIELTQATFERSTNITINEQQGTITAYKNSLIYFFIQGQQTLYKKTRAQFQSTAISYLKSKHQTIVIEENFVVQDQQINNNDEVKIDTTGNKYSTSNTKDNSIHFYVVKCPKMVSNIDNNVHICTNLGIYQLQQNQTVFFFTSNSEIIKYNQQITQDKLFLLISKVQQNSHFFQTLVTFDEQLQKMAEKYELKNISLKNQVYGLIEQVKSYLTWDLLKFLVIFGVLPFLFGYLNSKSQQKANKQRMQKYASNTQQPNKSKINQLKEQKKD